MLSWRQADRWFGLACSDSKRQVSIDLERITRQRKFNLKLCWLVQRAHTIQESSCRPQHAHKMTVAQSWIAYMQCHDQQTDATSTVCIEDVGELVAFVTNSWSFKVCSHHQKNSDCPWKHKASARRQKLSNVAPRSRLFPSRHTVLHLMQVQ